MLHPSEQSENDGATPPALERQRSLDEVFSLVYEELRRLASFIRRNEAGATLNSTALVHEAWIKLKDSPHLAATSIPHFKAIAAKAMRQVLVDSARPRRSQERRWRGNIRYARRFHAAIGFLRCRIAVSRLGSR